MMDEKLNLVVDIFNKAVEETVFRISERVKFIEEQYASVNDGVIPVLDKIGLYHAPCNNYKLPDTLDFSVSVDMSKLYSAGKILPNPITDQFDVLNRTLTVEKSIYKHVTCNYQEKLEIDAELALSIVEHFKDNEYIVFECSNPWHYQNMQTRILYMNARVEQVLAYFYVELKKALTPIVPVKYTGKAMSGDKYVEGTVIKIKKCWQPTKSGKGGFYYNRYLMTLRNNSTCYGVLDKDFDIGDVIRIKATFIKRDDHHSHFKNVVKMEKQK